MRHVITTVIDMPGDPAESEGYADLIAAAMRAAAEPYAQVDGQWHYYGGESRTIWSIVAEQEARV